MTRNHAYMLQSSHAQFLLLCYGVNADQDALGVQELLEAWA